MKSPNSVPHGLSGCLVALGVLAVLLSAPPPAMAKRFDCRMFCRSTGFTGMVGGCRCSFTLFTAKRSARDQHSVPNAREAMAESALGDGRYLSLADLVRMTRASQDNLEDYHMTGEQSGANLDTRDSSVNNRESQLPRETQITRNSGVNSESSVNPLPDNHPLRLLINGSLATQKPRNRVTQTPAQMLLKRKEFEQDLDNGDRSDFLRLPY